MCRKAISNFNNNKAAHPGLLLDRFLKEFDSSSNSKKDLFKKVIDTSRKVQGIYSSAFKYWKSTFPPNTLVKQFRSDTSLIVGLGSSTVLETGLTLHHTYGVPYIPGSALKGLAAHYCDSVWGSLDPDFRHHKDGKDSAPGSVYQVLFGTTDESGYIIFHDAWIDPVSLQNCFKREIMTPHHGDYYTSSGGKAPTDMESPTPIPFLSVRGTFHVPISVMDNSANWKQWANLVMKLLTEALEKWGIGGKTSSGYGYMIPKNSNTSKP